MLTCRAHLFSRFVLLLIFLFLSRFSAAPSHAQTIATESATITATVPPPPAGPDSIPPSAPILIRPLDGWTTTDTTPEFVWRQSTDPNGNYVAYTVYLNGVAKYLGVSNVGNSAGTSYTSSLDHTEVRLIPTVALPEGVYKWKVAAYDYAGNLTYSTEWTLTIDITPPPLTITDIDTHHNLHLSSTDPDSISSETSFDVTGPKDIYFTIKTEPYTTVSLSTTNPNGEVFNARGNSGHSGTLQLYLPLEVNTYSIDLTATDRANLVTILSPFTLNVIQSLITLPIPGVSPAPTFPVPPTLTELSSLLYNYPATISRIASRPSLAALYVGSIALAILLLLIFLKKRSNLVLLNRYGEPIPFATVTLPHLNKTYSLTKRHHGRIHLPELSSTTQLSIEVSGLSTHLCLLHNQRRYVVVV